ncbi:MAG: hypothetical protein ACJ8CR_20800, partial [Roseiflexaceae bacterium]
MLQQMLGGMPVAHGRTQPAPATETIDPATQQSSTPSAGTPDDNTSQAIFKQLAHALSVLSGTADLMLANKLTSPQPQTLRVWLRPNARQAEEAM